jgi:F-type H+-transporting ATPase subunit gamma
MPSIQDIRRRIRSVKSMQQLTRAMKMVAAARLRRAQDRVIAARPYATTMMRVLGRLAERATDYSHPLLDRRGDKHYLVVLVTADRGLCGGFNTNLVKAAQQFMRDHEGKQVDLVTVGRKGRDFFRRRKASIVDEYINVTARAVDHASAVEIAGRVMGLYTAEDSPLDGVFIVYNEFKSVLSQRVTMNQLLPIGAEALGSAPLEHETEPGQVSLIDYLYEQPPAEIFGRLLPRYIETQIFHALLESIASEHGARMAAMDAASKNAGEVISTLTLNMNRVRQASITREIIEVVSGAQALKG